jgi:hypothetical protein
MTFARLLSAFALLGAACLLTGCGGRPSLVEASGTVLRSGQPVPYLTVHFVPVDGKPSWGVTDENGRFSLKQNNKNPGVMTGTHTVWVEWRPLSPKDEMDPANARKPKDLEAILQKYGPEANSPLRIEVTQPTQDLEVKLD